MKLGLDYRAGGEERRKKSSRSRAESVTIGTRSTTACWARERSPNYSLLYSTHLVYVQEGSRHPTVISLCIWTSRPGRKVLLRYCSFDSVIPALNPGNKISKADPCTVASACYLCKLYVEHLSQFYEAWANLQADKPVKTLCTRATQHSSAVSLCLCYCNEPIIPQCPQTSQNSILNPQSAHTIDSTNPESSQFALQTALATQTSCEFSLRELGLGLGLGKWIQSESNSVNPVHRN